MVHHNIHTRDRAHIRHPLRRRHFDRNTRHRIIIWLNTQQSVFAFRKRPPICFQPIVREAVAVYTTMSVRTMY